MYLGLIGFINFLIFALSPVIFCALFLKSRPEKSFLPMLLLNSMIFYIMAVFHVSKYGFYFLYAANLLLYVPSGIKFARLSAAERNERLFTPGFFILIAFTTVTFAFLYNSIFASWDPISHWGKVVKLFIDDGKLGCEYPLDVVSHASYPAGAAMTSVVIHSCFFGHPFSEGIVVFAHELINLGAFLWLFGSLNWQNKTHIIKFTLLLLLLPILYLIACYDPCYTDTLLALMMAVCVYQTVTMDEYKASDIFMLSLVSGWMFMIRNAGWGYSIGLMLMMAIRLLQDRRKAFFDQQSGRFSYLKSSMLALFFLLPVVMKYLWEFLMKYYHTGQKFGGKNIDCEGLLEQFGSLDSPGWMMLLKYFIANWRNFIYIALLSYFFIKMYKSSQDQYFQRAIKSTAIFFLIAAPLFFGTMFVYYLFEFTELRLFPSLPRYSTNFLLIPAFVLLLLRAQQAASENGCVFRGKLIFDTSKRSNAVFILILSAVFTVIMLFAATTLYWFNGNTKYYKNTRQECDLVFKYQDVFEQTNGKFTILTTEGSGIRNFYMSYRLPKYFRAIQAWDPVLPESPLKKQRPYSQEITQDGLMQQWKPFDYVYIDRIKPDFIRSYSRVFVPEFTPTVKSVNHRLFKVTENLQLQPID